MKAYIESLLMQALTEALNNLTAMREKEGGAIRRDLLDKLDAMSQLVEEIQAARSNGGAKLSGINCAGAGGGAFG
ncbi:MAG: hypothetical protein ACLR23_04775 [Clostridia bacterium]